MITNWQKIVKTYLGEIPQNDYPVLNSFLFVSCWLNFVLDSSIESMRHLFEQLNAQGIKSHYSNFSKASQRRDPKIFKELLEKLVKKYQKTERGEILRIFPLDSTTITLTSKLLWEENIHQVKLFSGLDLSTEGLDGVSIYFGQGHDHKHGEKTIESTPKKGVAVMDRGFADLQRIKRLSEEEERYFVLRIQKSWAVEIGEDGKDIVGKDKRATATRIVIFCDLEKRREYRLVTNLPRTISNEEIAELYRLRWAIESLWKFLKMHLRLDKIITKNVNGIRIQIYASLIAYLLLGLIKIPKDLGDTRLSKFRFVLTSMKEKKSFVHWFSEIIFQH